MPTSWGSSTTITLDNTTDSTDNYTFTSTGRTSVSSRRRAWYYMSGTYTEKKAKPKNLEEVFGKPNWEI